MRRRIETGFDSLCLRYNLPLMAANTNDPELVRKFRVRQLWQARSQQERSMETGPLNFYKFLNEHYPHLLPPGKGDPYETLRAELIAEEGKESK